MEAIDKYDFKGQYVIGFPIFEKLYNMPRTQLVEKLRTMIIHERCRKILYHDGIGGVTVRKTETNDRPDTIALLGHDSMEITPFGISFKERHSNSSEKILEFHSPFFKF